MVYIAVTFNVISIDYRSKSSGCLVDVLSELKLHKNHVMQ